MCAKRDLKTWLYTETFILTFQELQCRRRRRRRWFLTLNRNKKQKPSTPVNGNPEENVPGAPKKRKLDDHKLVTKSSRRALGEIFDGQSRSQNEPNIHCDEITSVRKLPRATTNVQKNKSYVGLFVSYVGLIKSYVGLYNSYVGDKIS